MQTGGHGLVADVVSPHVFADASLMNLVGVENTAGRNMIGPQTGTVAAAIAAVTTAATAAAVAPAAAGCG